MITETDRANLATFIHRYAMRHERFYPHPIERVWRAVSSAKELMAWYVTGWTVEPRLGGRWSCTYGGEGPIEETEGYPQGFGHGVITAWDPPRLVDYGGQHRFELESVEGGTRLVWTQVFDPKVSFPLFEAEAFPDNPGGPGYPMTAGGQAGNHIAADDLTDYLDGKPIDQTPGGKKWEALTEAYDRHFRDHMPSETPAELKLATFDTRHRMRHVRVYPHPIERVFAAVSTAEHLDNWMLPHCRVDRREGGAWAMTFGGPDIEQAITGTIVAWDPPRLIDYGGMRFQLEPLGKGATRLTFIHSFAEGFVHAPTDQPGADLPGGPDTPWRPGFVAGFHIMMDDLDTYLSGRLTPVTLIDGAHPALHGHHETGWLALVAIYRAHIRDTIPGWFYSR